MLRALGRVMIHALRHAVLCGRLVLLSVAFEPLGLEMFGGDRAHIQVVHARFFHLPLNRRLLPEQALMSTHR